MVHVARNGLSLNDNLEEIAILVKLVCGDQHPLLRIAISNYSSSLANPSIEDSGLQVALRG